MANVYSVRLYDATNLAQGVTTSAAVPTGNIWIVRQVMAENLLHAPNFALNGVRLHRTSGPTFFDTGMGITRGGELYREELRYVMQAGETFVVVSREAGWDVAVMGYQLSLP